MKKWFVVLFVGLVLSSCITPMTGTFVLKYEVTSPDIATATQIVYKTGPETEVTLTNVALPWSFSMDVNKYASVVLRLSATGTGPGTLEGKIYIDGASVSSDSDTNPTSISILSEYTKAPD